MYVFLHKFDRVRLQTVQIFFDSPAVSKFSSIRRPELILREHVHVFVCFPLLRNGQVLVNQLVSYMYSERNGQARTSHSIQRGCSLYSTIIIRGLHQFQTLCRIAIKRKIEISSLDFPFKQTFDPHTISSSIILALRKLMCCYDTDNGDA
jgi:hypothetical protein